MSDSTQSEVSRRQVTSSTLWVALNYGFAKCLQLTTQIVLARLLAPRDFGVWAMLQILANLAIVFREFAVASALVHRGLGDKDLVNAVYSVARDMSVGLFAVQALAAWPMALFFDEPSVFPMALASSLGYLVGMGAGSHTAVLQSRMEFRRQVRCEAAGAIARVVVSVGGALLGAGVWSFVAGELAMVLVESWSKRLASRYRFTYLPPGRRDKIKEVRSFITGMLGINLALQINSIGDNVVVGKLLGSAKLGFYSVAYQLATMPVTLLSQINLVNFSAMSSLDAGHRAGYMRNSLQTYSVISSPVYAIAFVLAPTIIPVIYGPRWVEAAALFQVLTIFAFLRGMMSVMGTFLNALNHTLTGAWINWLLVPLSLGSYYFGARMGGTTGVAWSVVLALGLCGVSLFWIASARIGSLGYGFILPALVPPSLVAAITVLALRVTTHPAWQTLIVLFAYACVMLAFQRRILLALAARFRKSAKPENQPKDATGRIS